MYEQPRLYFILMTLMKKSFIKISAKNLYIFDPCIEGMREKERVTGRDNQEITNVIKRNEFKIADGRANYFIISLCCLIFFLQHTANYWIVEERDKKLI